MTYIIPPDSIELQSSLMARPVIPPTEIGKVGRLLRRRDRYSHAIIFRRARKLRRPHRSHAHEPAAKLRVGNAVRAAIQWLSGSGSPVLVLMLLENDCLGVRDSASV